MAGAAAPILYSFRRCPYAIRARLALLATATAVELREVDLKAKPPELLEVSPRATVPVLVLPSAPHGRGEAAVVIEESLAIMRWALAQRRPAPWWGSTEARADTLIASNDGPFKHHLDRFKYAGRYPGADASAHRQAALELLREWNRRLERHRSGGAEAPSAGLLGPQLSLVDWAVLPFVRQFRLADPQGFDAEPGLAALQEWLVRFLTSPQLAAVMAPPLAHRQPWPSPRWIYHLALRDEWRASEAERIYRRSTRGASLEEVGFIHASHRHQLEATHARFFAADDAVVVLCIDPQRLRQAGITVVEESPPGVPERFPHIVGPLPHHAVLRVDPWPPREAA
jgi:glutathione S-transferase